MIKLKYSVHNLVESKKKQINLLEVNDATKTHSNKMNLLIEIGNIRENKKSRHILGAKHVPSGMLEFRIDANIPYHKDFFNEDFNCKFYCASDWSSALARLSANNIGFLNTSHLIGGYNKWLELERPFAESR